MIYALYDYNEVSAYSEDVGLLKDHAQGYEDRYMEGESVEWVDKDGACAGVVSDKNVYAIVPVRLLEDSE